MILSVGSVIAGLLFVLFGPASVAASAKESRIYVCFRNDDLSAVSDVAHERKVMGIFNRWDARQTIGVIPCVAADETHDPSGTSYRSLEENPEIVTMLKRWIAEGKVEVALHGFTHRTNSVVTIPEREEFAEFRGLPHEEQCRRIRTGLSICEATLGVLPKVFIPPWNEWDENTVRACADNGITVFSAALHVIEFEGLLSVNVNCGLRSFADTLAKARKGSGPVFIVLVFHSSTIRSPEQLSLLEDAVAAASQAYDVKIVTLGEMARIFPDFARTVNSAGRNVIDQVYDVNLHRSQAALYRKVVRSIGIPFEIEDIYLRARREYYLGNYEYVASLSPLIDVKCAHLVLASRGLLVVAGFGSGLLIVLGLRRVTRRPLMIVLYCFAGIAIVDIGGALMVWLATATVTRQEIATGTGLLTGAVVVGMILVPVLSQIKGSRSINSAERSDAKRDYSRS